MNFWELDAMTKPIMGLDQLTEFKQFLNENFTSVGAVSLVAAACLVLLSLAAREVFAWFTKTDRIYREIKEIRKTLVQLEEDVQRIESGFAGGASPKVAPPFGGSDPTWANGSGQGPASTSGGGFAASQKPDSFPITQ